MLQRIRQSVKKEDGATAVEYVLLVVAIALIMVIGAVLLGQALNDRFDATADCVRGDPTAACPAVVPAP